MNQKQSEKLIKDLTFCVFDLETTGPNHQTDKIIEIGMVKIKNMEIVDQKEYLINPKIRIPDFIQKLTSIKNEDVVDAPIIEDVIDDILEFMGDSILVAHNISFDVPFFSAVLKSLKKESLKNKSLCTNLMTKYLVPTLINSNLNYMSSIFDIPHMKAHRALDDAKAAAQLLLIYLEFFIEKGINKVNHLYYPRNRFELDRKNFKKDIPAKGIIEELKDINIPYLITIKDDHGVILLTLPCLGNNDEFELITKYLENNNWEMVTIKLYGTYIEALIHYAQLSSKLTPETLDETLNYINQSIPKAPEDFKLPDFFIVNHLIPGQYIAFPTSSYNIRSQLIFTYPAQRKKLSQFLISKGQKLDKKNSKIKNLPKGVNDLINNYLKSSKDIFLIDKDLPKKNNDVFLNQFNSFVKKNPNSGIFPKKHI